ncbi:MAG: DUF4926 domain-containing protein [Chloroflexi bacterium]|nr:DUF4926 domain-containing protein [Chloroflexota bacterium]
MIEEHERIALTVDVPEHGLKAGDIGMVVHIYGQHTGYTVEFVTVTGRTVALVSVFPEQIRALEPDEIATARRVATA